ncbi:MAG: PstS family phosphate ABC transporter substrate-binding protein [Gammaproteobacteria bacterium]|nr:PstS family phosphate ABC transporter substrate-binding protein [Gammaproteobacteria bacterium]MBU1724357.1 PstS family phosphate ABC transporter substrate-binding protein [Gammaproteobacteria bacterium]MBU2006051.1 PstS family phosphate ABC transporter substrate-binding protein [Gammaproteobacteria bacterium]
MKQLTLAVAMGLLAATGVAQARDNIEIVGSSTVYPFSTAVAEQFAKKTGMAAPKVESTGTGGGMKLFCAGAGIDTPDITNASRRMKKKEMEDCLKNGVNEVTEIKVGFDGIAVGNHKSAQPIKLSRRELYLALAKDVPADPNGELIPNPYTTWKQVNPELADIKIEVMGPPPTSGTRDALAELGMEKGCNLFKGMPELKKKDEKAHKAACTAVREDGHYIESGENDNLIVQKLQANPNAVGIFGYSFYDQNRDSLQAATIDGKEISYENISSGKYPLSRPLFFYVKNSHVGQVPGIKEFMAEFTSEEALSADGYLADKGLVALPANEKAASATAAASMATVAASVLK